MSNHPALIDYLCSGLKASARAEFFGHLVALQRFEAAGRSERFKSIVEEDRSSIVYFLLTGSQANTARLKALLDKMEHHKPEKNPRRRSSPLRKARAPNGVDPRQVRHSLEGRSAHDPNAKRLRLIMKFAAIENRVIADAGLAQPTAEVAIATPAAGNAKPASAAAAAERAADAPMTIATMLKD